MHRTLWYQKSKNIATFQNQISSSLYFQKCKIYPHFSYLKYYSRKFFFSKMKKMGMLTVKKNKFRYLNGMDFQKNLPASCQLHVLAESMLYFQLGSPSMTVQWSKNKRVKKLQNLLSYGFFSPKSPMCLIIHFLHAKKYGITSYWLNAYNCIPFLYLYEHIAASGLFISGW